MPQTFLQTSLLSWYGRAARDLPWRRTKDPYKIWVSEIMLQQTQVQTVIPYYEKWLKRFPDLVSLAEAPEAEVMKYWAGLGYYRRARMLHKAAKTVLEKSGGEVPSDPAALLELPGIGRYTAGAIASIAFGAKAPILDGNVIRILSRIFALKEDISAPASLKKFWEISSSILPEKDPGDFNQAMMELGATVCLPQNPKCAVCPVSGSCKAFAMKEPESFPVNRKKERLEKIKSAAVVFRKNGKVLLEKQPSEARWGGLWMFPHGKDKTSVLKKFGLEKETVKHRLRLFHGFTKYKVQLDVFEGGWQPGGWRGGGSCHEKHPVRATRLALSSCSLKWVRIRDLKRFALPAPHRKICEGLLDD